MLRVLVAVGLAAGAQIGYLWTFDELEAKADLVVIAEPLRTMDVGTHEEPRSDARAIPFVERRTDLKVLSVSKPDARGTVTPGAEIHLRHTRVDVDRFRSRNPAAPGQPPPGLLNTGTSLDFDAHPGAYLLFLKRRGDGDYEPLSGQTFPTDSVFSLVSTASQMAMSRGEPLPDVAAELRAVQDDDWTSDVIPVEARQLMPALRRELAARVQRSLNAMPDAPIGQVEAYVRADVDAALRAGISDAAAGPYGNSVDVQLRMVPGATDLAIAAVQIGIKCGGDTSLHVFKRSVGWWSPVVTLASRPSASIGVAWGSLEYAAESDGHGGFILAVADVNPWCSSNWQSLRYRVYRGSGSPFGVRQLFGDRRTIYLGVDDPIFTMELRGRRLELRFHGDWTDEDEMPEHRIVYDVGPREVRRMLETPLPRRRQ